MSHTTNAAQAIRIGDRYFRGFGKGGRVLTAWTLAGAKLFRPDDPHTDLQSTLTKVNRSRRRGVPVTVAVSDVEPQLRAAAKRHILAANNQLEIEGVILKELAEIRRESNRLRLHAALAYHRGKKAESQRLRFAANQMDIVCDRIRDSLFDYFLPF